jgi:hypothetical protein
MSLRLNGSTSGYTELDAGAVAGNNTIKMPTANGSANQLLRNGSSAGSLEFAPFTLPATTGSANQLLRNSATPGSLEFAPFTLPATTGSAYQILRNSATPGETELVDKIGSYAGTSASSTSIDFGFIPSWVKRITVMFSGVSTSGTSNLQIQLGDSGGFETSSYLGAESTSVGATASVHSAGFIIKTGVAAASIFHGVVVLALLNASTNTWAESGNIATSNTTQVGVSAGSKALSATLDRVRITTVNGTDTFDAGTVNILYE